MLRSIFQSNEWLERLELVSDDDLTFGLVIKIFPSFRKITILIQDSFNLQAWQNVYAQNSVQAS